jgi:hypothetical protein
MHANTVLCPFFCTASHLLVHSLAGRYFNYADFKFIQPWPLCFNTSCHQLNWASKYCLSKYRYTPPLHTNLMLLLTGMKWHVNVSILMRKNLRNIFTVIRHFFVSTTCFFYGGCLSIRELTQSIVEKCANL